MKVLLANPPCKEKIALGYEKYFVRAGSRWAHSGIKRIGEAPHYVPFPFFLAYAAALLLDNDFPVRVIDAVALDMSEDAFVQKVLDTDPDAVLLETATPTIEHDLDLVRRLKRHIHPTVILSGPHATTFAGSLLREVPEIDYVALGEYEISVLRLLLSLRQGKPLENMPGIAYRHEGNIVEGERAPLIDPLDELPFPARDLFPLDSSPDMNVYWDSFCQHRPAIQMHSSRGCPYHCYFCLWNEVMYQKGKYRTFSPARVVDEMEEVVSRYGAREIYFDDDDLTINRKHVLGICREIKKRGLTVKWSCMGDAINLDEAELKEMAASGCVGMKFGVESGSPEVLQRLGKPVKLKRVKQVARWCGKYGIKTHATFSIGLLEETVESMRRTLDFARGLDVDTIQVSICTPYPGTAFYEEARSRGFMRSSGWGEFDGKAREILSYPNLDGRTMEKFRQFFFRTWLLDRFRRPLWLRHQLRNLIRMLRGMGFTFTTKRIYAELREELMKREAQEP